MKSKMITVLVLTTLFSLVSLNAQIADPGSIASYRVAQVGQVLEFKITGKTTGGSVWGTDIYTADSNLAMAAVHAGVLQSGQTGVVKVEILPGASSYAGSPRSGVTSSNWGSYGMGYRFVTGSTGGAYAFTSAAVLPSLAEYIGQSFLFFLEAGGTGSVWGSGPYTLDSSLSRVAVHSGVLANGKTGLVKVNILPGQNSYSGSTKNGIPSSSWGAFATSYTVEAASGSYTPLHLGATSANVLPGASAGATLAVLITGKSSGSVWGSGPYTADSNLGVAAVHSGLLTVGQTGVLKVKFVPGQSSYTGSKKGGVNTSNWGAFGLGFVLEK